MMSQGSQAQALNSPLLVGLSQGFITQHSVVIASGKYYVSGMNVARVSMKVSHMRTFICHVPKF